MTGQYAHAHGVLDNVTPLPPSDPAQKTNLLGGARLTTEYMGVTERIANPELKEQVNRYRHRIKQILTETSGSFTPGWSRW